jgi:hypothetical protein
VSGTLTSLWVLGGSGARSPSVGEDAGRPGADNGLAGWERITMSSETYEIVTRGRMSPPLVHALDGFTVLRVEYGLSHLIGTVPDQARLHEILRLLRDMSTELVSINSISS